MKNLLLLLALLISVSGLSQVQIFEVNNKNINSFKKAWYKNREDKKEKKKKYFASLYRGVQGMDLVVTPDFYNSTQDTNLLSIEFIQDTVHFHSDFAFMQPTCTVFDKNYTIGYVMDYMIDKDHVGLYINKKYKDNTTKMIYIKMHLDIVLLYCNDESEKLETAEPITNSYYDYEGYDWE